MLRIVESSRRKGKKGTTRMIHRPPVDLSKRNRLSEVERTFFYSCIGMLGVMLYLGFTHSYRLFSFGLGITMFDMMLYQFCPKRAIN